MNELSIEVFPSDTLESLSVRVADLLNSLPKYIYLENTSDIAVGKINLHVFDFFKMLKVAKGSFTSLYTAETQKLLSIRKLNLIDDIVKPFLFYNVDSESSWGQELQLADLTDQITSTLKLKDDAIFFPSIQALNLAKEKFFKTLQIDIEENKKLSDASTREYKEMTMASEVTHTSFQQDAVEIKIITNLVDQTILKVFDKLKLSPSCPIAFVNGFYKIFLDANLANINLDEFMAKDNVLRVFLNSQKVSLQMENNSLTITTNTLKEDRSVFKLELEKILGPFSIVEEVEIDVSGNFLIPRQQINSDIFAFLVMNDKRFSRKLFLDESMGLTKHKEGFYAFYDTSKIVISPKQVQKYDYTLRDVSLKDKNELFPVGSFYINVKIKAKTITMALEFVEFFSKLLTFYNAEKEKVEKLFQFFIPEFDSSSPPPLPSLKTTKLTKLAPNFFKPSYSKKCTNKVVPVTQEEAQAFPEHSIMLYPENESSEQYLYACTDKQYPYIRLIKNDPTATQPFVPCCGKNEPTKSVELLCSSAIDTRRKEQKEFVKIKKILDRYQYGSLRNFNNVDYIFNTLGKPNSDTEFFRMGVDRTKLSFLQCVVEALHVSYEKGDESCQKRLDSLHQLQLKIAKSNSVHCAWQSFSTSQNVKEIEKLCMTQNVYFAPDRMLDILEDYFNCKIFVFGENEIKIPNHVQNYITQARQLSQNCIFILEHYGSEGENLQFPQCELIVQVSSSKSTPELLFTPSSDKTIIDIAFHFFNTARLSFSIRRQAINYSFEDIFYRYAIHQMINACGKATGIVIEVKGHQIAFLTENPMPPLAVANNSECPLADFPSIKKFLANFGQKITAAGENLIRIVSRQYGNIYFIPVSKSDMTVSKRVQFLLPESNSTFAEFVAKRRIATVLQEYAKYLLSAYAHREQLQFLTDQNVYDFAQEFLIFDETFEYKSLPRTFGVDSAFVRNGRIVINTKELFKRLLFFLKVHKNDLPSYRAKALIPPSYLDAVDFIHRPSHVIVQGFDNFKTLIKNLNSSHTFSSIALQLEKPYIFLNNLISSNTPFLAFYVRNMTIATSILYSWDLLKSVRADLQDISSSVSYELFSYNSEFDITALTTTPAKNKILKHNNGRLTVLLQL